MTFADVRHKILNRWLLILVFVIAFTVSFFPWSSANSYLGAIGFGVSLNSDQYLQSADGNESQAYVESLEAFSLYLTARFTSIEVQGRISTEAGLGISNFNPITPFYDVKPQNGGYVSLSFESSSEQAVKNFIGASKKIYLEIVATERISGELDKFKISPKAEFIESINLVSKPVQFRIFPSIVGMLVGLCLAIIIPNRD